ncbi:MAG: KilA-N domain-containing protein [Candidatus Accumulibacter sp.]|nr:KilA-N domain-containing protein [Accumulibacter sp.]
MAHVLTLGTAEIRQHDGLYSLNDFHKASGGETSQRPGEFIRNQQTQDLIAEISTAGIPAVHVINGGPKRGTYACRELVIAYAAWISAAFHLKVIRVFLDTQAQKPGAGGTANRPALPPHRRIRSRLDLSMTARDSDGRFLNWRVPSREGQWHEHAGIGEAWFAEVVELALHSPKDAYDALSASGAALLPHWNHGHESGFMERFARWAVVAMIEHRGQLPALPFKPRTPGIAPREGFEHYRQQAVPQRLPDELPA